MKLYFTSALIFIYALAFSQSNKPATTPHNWQLMDWQQDGYPGISLEKAYAELLKNKKPLKKIIVAVVDCGLDETQPDLAAMEWTNKKEIPGNGIDDDGNGYVDDVHGWNFTANLEYETYEEIREYVKLRGKFENKADSNELKKDPQYNYWKKIVAAKNEKMFTMTDTHDRAVMILNTLQTLQNYWSKKFGKDSVYTIDVKTHHPDSGSNS
jgi:cell wall-associated protease